MDINDDSGVDIEPIGLGCSLEKFSEAQEITTYIENLPSYTSDLKKYEKDYERFKYIINLYKEQPHLTHQYLNGLLDKIITVVKCNDVDISVKHKAFKYMYLLTNVAGYKIVVQFLPHSAADLEPVLYMLETQDKHDTGTWETRYCLILWLSIVVKIPFHMSRLDFVEKPDQKTISDRIIGLCKEYLLMRDSCRIACAILCAHFFTRVDIKELYLKQFLQWMCQVIKEKNPDVDNIGVLGALASILKLGKREDVLPYCPELLDNLLSFQWKNEPFRLSRKFSIKVIQRIGLAFLKPKVVSWRYKRGLRSITENLAVRGSSGDQLKTESSEEPEEDEPIDVPQQIEEVIEQLIQSLKDPDLTVRWCGAKGIGRVTGRLNKELGDEVVGCVLELLTPREGESAWHGGCLALAELGKRGLLLPNRLDEVMPVLKRALVYDEPRGFASVGAIVRDAACYVSWAFARAYDTQVLKPYVHDLANSLVIATCYDREINIRRAASAAFQEHIGRQGSFPHGIEILTTADYFSVAVRSNAYLNISIFIAQFNDYTNSLIDHLVERKIEHWDVAIRELSSQALHKLTQFAPDYMIEIVLPTLLQKTNSIDVNLRHGAILSIGEIIEALYLINRQLSKEVEEAVMDLVKTIKTRDQFRGLSGELMKTACCHLIYKCSLAPLPFHSLPVLEEWQWLIDECLVNEVWSVRQKGGQALSALSKTYYQSDSPLETNLLARYTKGVTAKEEIARLGSTLAIGCLPSNILRLGVKEVVDCLIHCATISPATEKWVESRREATKALASIASTLGFKESEASCRSQLCVIIECLIYGLKDYTVDDRGDTGAWVREASLSSLQTVLIKGAEEAKEELNEEQIRIAMCRISQQAVERIDRTRFLAVSVFTNILYSEVPFVPEKEKLKEIFPDKGFSQENWLTSYEMFPKFIQLMPLSVYTRNLLEGFIISIGGLTESLVKSASKCLFGWLSGQTYEEKDRICLMSCEIFQENIADDRITQPMASYLELLLSSGAIRDYLLSPETSFPSLILALTKTAFSNSTMKFKLIGSINICCQLLQVGGVVSKQAVGKLMLLVCHKFGWVRKSAAQSLYESLMVSGDCLTDDQDNVDSALTLLSDTEWAITPVADLRPIRNQICALLGVPSPVLLSKT